MAAQIIIIIIIGVDFLYIYISALFSLALALHVHLYNIKIPCCHLSSHVLIFAIMIKNETQNFKKPYPYKILKSHKIILAKF